jgi:hypothetical protein
MVIKKMELYLGHLCSRTLPPESFFFYAHTVFAGKPEGERVHGSCMHKCEDNIKMDFNLYVW